MSKLTRRNHSPAFKAIKGEKTLAELAQLHDVHPTQIAAWKIQLVKGAAGLFGSGSDGKSSEPAVDLKTLHRSADRIANHFARPGVRSTGSAGEPQTDPLTT
jgi:transposase-like protein